MKLKSAYSLPAYSALSDKEFSEKIDGLYDLMRPCELCPRRCRADRMGGEKGLCGAGDKLRIASINLHFGEEPPVSGITGSGAIFFSGCPLKCKFCQNYPISRYCIGNLYDTKELAEGMFKLQEKGACNINLVSSSHFMPFVAESIFLSKKMGLSIPIVYNSSGYESETLLDLLNEIVDIYLPDIKYSSNKDALRYSGVKDYVEVNKLALRNMYNQVKELVVNEQGVAVSGLMIRHLALPAGISGYKDSFKFIAEELGEDIPVSLMKQYFPAYKAIYNSNINRKITDEEYAEAILDMTNANLTGYFQEDSSLIF